MVNWNTSPFLNKKKSILSSGGLVLLYIVLAKLVQFVKELFVARDIGVSGELDAFIIALMITSIGINTFFAPLGLALMPSFMKERSTSVSDANGFFNTILFVSVILTVTLSFLIYSNVDVVISYFNDGLSSRTVSLASEYTLYLFPYFILNTASVLFVTYLSALNKRFFYSVYQAFPALFTIVFFVLNFGEPIENQLIGFNLGSFIALAFILAQCVKEGYRLEFGTGYNARVMWVLGQWLPLIFASLVSASNMIVDRVMASSLGDGAISTLDYGNKVYSIFSSLAVTGISVLLFPKFSEKVNSGELDSVWRLVRQSFCVAIVPIVAVVGVTYSVSSFLVGFLFERGQFTHADTLVVAEVMRYYLLNIPIYIFGIMGVRLLNALQWNYIVAFYGIINLVLNVSLNYIFMGIMGLPGIALSTTVVVIVNAILVWGTLFFRMRSEVSV